jgi:ribosomal protein S18 acetylase RimI-like enzyme
MQVRGRADDSGCALPRNGELFAGDVRVRVRPWNDDPGRAFLLVTGGHLDTRGILDADEVARWLPALRGAGYVDVRTNALAPGPAAAFSAAGFAPIQSLVLLSRTLDGVLRARSTGAAVAGIPRWRALWPGQRLRTRLVTCDAASFPGEWAMDDASLRDALAATTVARVFTHEVDGTLVGFLLAGSTGDTGYIQRLAVGPPFRRCGVASSLLSESLTWLAAVGCTTVVVNTERDNAAAIALYDSLGFVAEGTGLCVMAREL